MLDKQKVGNVKMAVSGLGAVFVAEFCFNWLVAVTGAEYCRGLEFSEWLASTCDVRSAEQ